MLSPGPGGQHRLGFDFRPAVALPHLMVPTAYSVCGESCPRARCQTGCETWFPRGAGCRLPQSCNSRSTAETVAQPRAFSRCKRRTPLLSLKPSNSSHFTWSDPLHTTPDHSPDFTPPLATAHSVPHLPGRPSTNTSTHFVYLEYFPHPPPPPAICSAHVPSHSLGGSGSKYIV